MYSCHPPASIPCKPGDKPAACSWTCKSDAKGTLTHAQCTAQCGKKEDDNDDSLSPGAIAGIVVGSAAFIVLVVTLSVVLTRKKRRQY